MKQKIKGRLYRCGNLKDHCLCPLFNCCIWSFEGSLSAPSLCQVPAWLERPPPPPPGPRHVEGQEPQTPLSGWPFPGNVEQAGLAGSVWERLGGLSVGRSTQPGEGVALPETGR